MDRPIVYPGSIPLDTHLLATNQDAMAAIGGLLAATLGNSMVVDGLAITATASPSMVVNVGPGTIIALTTLEGLGGYGSLPIDTTTPLVKMGQNLVTTPFTLTAPGVAGQSINYLIEATFLEVDAGSTVLPYYNAGNPAVPYSGPSNSGTAQMTLRTQRVSLQLKAGTAAVTGTQTTPAVDSGWVGLYVVTVAFGQTTVTNANLVAAQIAAAPFIPFKLPALRPGFASRKSFFASGTWIVPNGVTKVRARVVGGGGGGGGCTLAAGAGGGGSAGGYAEDNITVTPGASMTVTVGAVGTAGPATTGTSGGNGGVSSFGGLTGNGGIGGQLANPNFAGGDGGTGTGGSADAINASGGDGTDGNATYSTSGGLGGASAFGGAGRAGAGAGRNGKAPGAGAGGCYGSAGTGGVGAAGIVILEW